MREQLGDRLEINVELVDSHRRLAALGRDVQPRPRRPRQAAGRDVARDRRQAAGASSPARRRRSSANAPRRTARPTSSISRAATTGTSAPATSLRRGIAVLPRGDRVRSVVRQRVRRSRRQLHHARHEHPAAAARGDAEGEGRRDEGHRASTTAWPRRGRRSARCAGGSTGTGTARRKRIAARSRSIRTTPPRTTATRCCSPRAAASTKRSSRSRKAADLDPLSLIIAVHAGWPFYFARDFESAIRRFRKALELDEHFIPAHGWLGMALGQQRRYAEALDAFARALEVDRIPILMAMLAHTYAIAGERDKALSAPRRARDRGAERYISPYDIAVVHAGLGDTRAAIAQLRAAVDDRSAWMVFLNVDPRLDALRTTGFGGSWPRYTSNLSLREGPSPRRCSGSLLRQMSRRTTPMSRKELLARVYTEQIIGVVREDSAEAAEAVAEAYAQQRHPHRRDHDDHARRDRPDGDAGQALRARRHRHRRRHRAQHERRGAGAARGRGDHRLAAHRRAASSSTRTRTTCSASPAPRRRTEIIRAWEAGCDVVKVYPAQHLGGPDYIRTIRGPIRDVPMLAGGPVPLDMIDAYLDAGCIAVNLGGSLAVPDLVRAAAVGRDRPPRRAGHVDRAVARGSRASRSAVHPLMRRPSRPAARHAFPPTSRTPWMRLEAFHLAIGMTRAEAADARSRVEPEAAARTTNELVVDYSGDKALTLEFQQRPPALRPLRALRLPPRGPQGVRREARPPRATSASRAKRRVDPDLRQRAAERDGRRRRRPEVGAREEGDRACSRCGTTTRGDAVRLLSTAGSAGASCAPVSAARTANVAPRLPFVHEHALAEGADVVAVAGERIGDDGGDLGVARAGASARSTRASVGSPTRISRCWREVRKSICPLLRGCRRARTRTARPARRPAATCARRRSCPPSRPARRR